MHRVAIFVRPRLLLVLALVVLAAGLASGVGRNRQRAAAGTALPAAVVYSVDTFDDTPTTTTSPRAVDPPEPAPVAPAPADPVAAVPAPAPDPAPAAAPPPPAPTPAPEAAPAPAPPAVPPRTAPIIPLGKGMWLHQLSQAAGGNAEAVVAKAKKVGLTHLYLRLGSSKKGFYAQPELDRLLPAAHAAGLKVIGWDFPYLFDPAADAVRAKAEIDYATPDGHRIDAFSADIETASEGVNLTAEGAEAYGAKLRELAGASYPLIATVPRPSPKRWFPFVEATRHFDAIAPMVYWQNRDPATDVAGALADLAPLGKPVLPIGQAYDGEAEGGPAGPPPKDALVRFMDMALARGALGVSFWVWHTTTAEQWSAIDGARQWELPAGTGHGRGAVVYLQRVLGLLGQPVAQDGLLGPATRAALATVQQSLGLPGTGLVDPPTVHSIVGPRV